MNKTYGIKTIDLTEYFPSFLDDCNKHLVNWKVADSDVYGRIQTFLILIAKLHYTELNCYYCVYPYQSSAEYTVFVDLDAGKQYLLLTTIRDHNYFSNDARRINTLKEDLILLNVSQNLLSILHQEMPVLPHPDEPCHH